MSKESFLIYKSFYEPIKTLTNEQLGRLFRALFEYNLEGSDNVADDISMAFMFFKNQFRLDDIKYADKCAKNKANASGRIRSVAMDAYKEKEKEKNKEKDKEKDNEKDKENISFEKFFDDYHKITKLKKTDKASAQKKWKSLTDIEKTKAVENITNYFNSLSDKKYCKKARTYLNDKNFNDEFTAKPSTAQLCQWEIPSLGEKRTGTYQQYEADLKRNAPLQTNFLGYVK